MAKFKISSEEHLKYQEDLIRQPKKKKSSFKKVLLWIVLILALGCSATYKQYLFLVALGLVVAFFIWMTKWEIKKQNKDKYQNSRFLNEEIEAEFSDRVFKIKVGLNNITLAVKDLHVVRELDEVYFLSHYSGLQVFIPHAQLSREEKSTLAAYKKRFDDGYRDQT